MSPAVQFDALNTQRGTVLIITLLLLTGATILGVASMDSSVMGLRMASTVESNVQTFQMTQSAVDFAISDATNLPSVGPLGIPHAVTTSGPAFTLETGDQLLVQATRVVDCAPPPRSTAASSLSAFSGFQYEVKAAITKDVSSGGRAETTQGYLLLGPKC